MGPRRPSNFNKRSPVATGGITSGREMTVSTMDLPGHWRRASSQLMASPKGKIINVLRMETRTVNQTSCQSPFSIGGRINSVCPGRPGVGGGSAQIPEAVGLANPPGINPVHGRDDWQWSLSGAARLAFPPVRAQDFPLAKPGVEFRDKKCGQAPPNKAGKACIHFRTMKPYA